MQIFNKTPIPKNLIERYKIERLDENRRRVKLLSTLILIAGIVVSIQHQVMPGEIAPKDSDLFFYYRYVFAALVISSITGFIVLKFIRHFSTFFQSVILGTLTIVYLSIGLWLNLVDLIHSEELMAFLVFVIVIDSLVRSSWGYIIFLHAYSFLFITIGVLAFPPTLEAFNHFYLLIYIMIGILFWWTQNKVFKNGFLMRMELEQKILEKEVAEERLKNTQNQLIEKAHQAGMAQIATDTIHNVGNILNSLKTSTQIIKETLVSSPVSAYSKACDLLRDNKDDLKNFLLNDPKGVKLLDYFLLLEEDYKDSFQTIQEHIQRLEEKTGNITDVVIAQQSFVKSTSMSEPTDITTVIEESLLLVPELMNKKQFQVEKNYSSIPILHLSRTKLLHAFVNLFSNAVHALTNSNSNPKKLTISVIHDGLSINVQIKDNGYGISPENLKKLFNHGFTTKTDGNGFGLHSCANYLQEMGAVISADSEGVGRGAIFSLHFPSVQ